MTDPAIEDILAISRHFDRLQRDEICCGTVTVQQCFVLQHLLQQGEQKNAALADRAGSSPSAMTRLVDGLKKRGWVERIEDPNDRRKVQITLTDSGREEASRLTAITEESISTVFSQIPESKRDQVRESITILKNALESVGGISCC